MMSSPTFRSCLILLVTVLVVAGCAGPSSRLEPGVKKDIRQAQAHLDAGKLLLAEKSLRHAIGGTKHKADVYLIALEMSLIARSRHGISAGNTAAGFGRELLDLSDAGKLDRKLTSSELYMLLQTYGALRHEMQQLDEAIRALERAHKLWPDDAAIANDLGYMYAEADTKLGKALTLTRMAVRSSAENGMYVDSLGWVYYKLNRNREAVRELEKAVRLTPDAAELRYHLGMAYLALGRKPQASIEFSKALALDRAHAGARAELHRLRSPARKSIQTL